MVLPEKSMKIDQFRGMDLVMWLGPEELRVHVAWRCLVLAGRRDGKRRCGCRGRSLGGHFLVFSVGPLKMTL